MVLLSQGYFVLVYNVPWVYIARRPTQNCTCVYVCMERGEGGVELAFHAKLQNQNILE